MKKIIVFLFILVIDFGEMYMLNHNNDNDINKLTNEEEIVLNKYKEMQQAMIDKDIDKLDSIVKDGTTFTHMSGKIETKEEYFNDIKNGLLDYQSYTIEKPIISIKENKATIKARVTLTANAYGAQGSYPFNVSAYFEKINGKWFYINNKKGEEK